MMTNPPPRWTKEEQTYLEEYWGVKSLKVIATNLNRSVKSVREKAHLLNLRKPSSGYDGITLRELAKTLNVWFPTIRSWITLFDFPAKKKVFTCKQRVYVVTLDDFWDWAFYHRDVINFNNFEPLSLGKEPEWVAHQRKISRIQAKSRQPWTAEERNTLLCLVKEHKYTYSELSVILKRSEYAIRTQLTKMNTKYRPLPSTGASICTDEELDDVIARLREGDTLSLIISEMNYDKDPFEFKNKAKVRHQLKNLGVIFSRDKIVAMPTQPKKKRRMKRIT
ncbi:hypothetical protein ACQKJG_17910 [Priestia megaterium]|uniref:hypothetical protein n=1 Tax=Priestia megaterium TaxID=1404 RepID=UPI003CFC7022